MATFWASVFVFGILIFFHELGHFVVAKTVGVKVHEFSLGFGPKVLGVARDETNYNLRLLPLGGFVRMAGMDPEEEAVETGKGFGDKTIMQRMAVITAGPLMNFLLAAILFAAIFVLQGIPVLSKTIEDVLPGKPAEKAGLKSGDEIYSIAGEKMNAWEDISSTIKSHPGENLTLIVIRDGQQLQINVMPKVEDDGQVRVGIAPAYEFEKINPLSAIVMGFDYTYQVTVLIFQFVGKMIIGQAPAELGGPVRVVYEIDQAVQTGFFYLLRLAAFLSINLGLFNLFPIPALDGSRIMFLGLEGIRGRPVDPNKENFIHLVGFSILLMLIIFITYNDILHLFTQKP